MLEALLMQTRTAVLHHRFQTYENFLAKITLKLLQICAIISEVSSFALDHCYSTCFFLEVRFFLCALHINVHSLVYILCVCCGLSILPLLWVFDRKMASHTVGVRNCLSRMCVLVWLIIKGFYPSMWVGLCASSVIPTCWLNSEFVTCTVQWKTCPENHWWHFVLLGSFLTKWSQKEWIRWVHLRLLEYKNMALINHKAPSARWCDWSYESPQIKNSRKCEDMSVPVPMP